MEFWVHRNGKYAGQFSEPAIREKIADGSFNATDLVWHEAVSAWQPIPEFLNAKVRPDVSSATTVATANVASVPAAKSELESKGEAPQPSRATPPPLPVST